MIRKRVEIPPLPPRSARSVAQTGDRRTQREVVVDDIRNRAAMLGIMREDLGELHGLAAMATIVDDLLAEAVGSARTDGYSWAQIGEATGMSKQAAQQRYGRVLGAGVGNLRAERGG